jgi:hypothetical protein
VRDVPRRLGRWLAGRPPAAILAAGWVVALVYAYPGLMTFDSIRQLKEGRAGFYTDGHPPAMAALWGAIDALVAGPIGMLVIQTTAFLAGTYLVLRRAMGPRPAAVVAALVLVFPPVLAPMAVIWKDCTMAGFLMLGIGALLASGRRAQLAGLACLTVATAVRYNTFAATLPAIALLFAWHDHGWRRYAIALGAWLAITVVALGFDAAITDRRMHVWQSSLAVLDLAGTLAHVEEPLSDDELRATLAATGLRVDRDIHAAIKRQYALCREHGMDFEPLIVRDGHLWDLPLIGSDPAPPVQRDAIARAFWDVVTAHPGAYLAHRAAATIDVLGLSSHRVGGTVITHRSQFAGPLAELGLGSGSSTVQDWMQHQALRLARGTPLFQPWLYLVLALAMLPFAWRQRDVLALLASGLVFEGTLVPLAPTPDYRYSHWMLCCTIVAIAMLIARRARLPA